MSSQKLRYFLIVLGVFIGTRSGPCGRCATPGQKSAGKPLEFRLVMMGETIDDGATKAGFRSDGLPLVHLGFVKYEASDGEKLTFREGGFGSPEGAKRYLDWKVAASSKILEQGIKADSKGKPVGYRAVVLLAPDQKESAVMWTNGAFFRQIIAKSLADAEELEKRSGH